MRYLLFISLLVGLSACPVTVAQGPGPRRGGPEPVEPGPGPGPGPRPRGAILTGVIRNAATHEPVKGVSVDVTSPVLGNRTLNVQTGADGRYTTEPIPPGDFAIRVRRDGYEVIDQHMHVGNVEAVLDIELRPKR